MNVQTSVEHTGQWLFVRFLYSKTTWATSAHWGRLVFFIRNIYEQRKMSLEEQEVSVTGHSRGCGCLRETKRKLRCQTLRLFQYSSITSSLRRSDIHTLQLSPNAFTVQAKVPSGFMRSLNDIPSKFPHRPPTFLLYIRGRVISTGGHEKGSGTSLCS